MCCCWPVSCPRGRVADICTAAEAEKNWFSRCTAIWKKIFALMRVDHWKWIVIADVYWDMAEFVNRYCWFMLMDMALSLLGRIFMLYCVLYVQRVWMYTAGKLFTSAENCGMFYYIYKTIEILKETFSLLQNLLNLILRTLKDINGQHSIRSLTGCSFLRLISA